MLHPVTLHEVTYVLLADIQLHKKPGATISKKKKKNNDTGKCPWAADQMHSSLLNSIDTNFFFFSKFTAFVYRATKLFYFLQKSSVVLLRRFWQKHLYMFVSNIIINPTGDLL